MTTTFETAAPRGRLTASRRWLSVVEGSRGHRPFGRGKPPAADRTSAVMPAAPPSTGRRGAGAGVAAGLRPCRRSVEVA